MGASWPCRHSGLDRRRGWDAGRSGAHHHPDAVPGRSLGGFFKAPSRAYGWCRTHWSCATVAAQLAAKHRWVWKRAKLNAKDTDPQRVKRLARIKCHFEYLGGRDVMVFANELDIHLLPKVA